MPVAAAWVSIRARLLGSLGLDAGLGNKPGRLSDLSPSSFPRRSAKVTEQGAADIDGVLAYCLLRTTVGLLFLSQGAHTVLAACGESVSMRSMHIFAGLLEIVLGGLVALGFQTRIAALVASAEIVAGNFIFSHAQGVVPSAERAELSLVYTFLFLYMSTRDAGLWSLDGRLNRKASKPARSLGLG